MDLDLDVKRERRAGMRKEPGHVQGFDPKQKPREEGFHKDIQVHMLLCANMYSSLDDHHPI